MSIPAAGLLATVQCFSGMPTLATAAMNITSNAYYIQKGSSLFRPVWNCARVYLRGEFDNVRIVLDSRLIPMVNQGEIPRVSFNRNVVTCVSSWSTSSYHGYLTG